MQPVPSSWPRVSARRPSSGRAAARRSHARGGRRRLARRLRRRCATNSASSTLIDLCGVDYLGYGSDEWDTATCPRKASAAASKGRARAASTGASRPATRPARRGRRRARRAPFRAWSLHLLSIAAQPAPARALLRAGRRRCRWCASVTGLWPGANWFEREAFDLFGIVFDGHPGPAPHPHRLRFRRPSVPQGFPADRQRRSALRRREEARGLRAGHLRSSRACGVPRVIRDDARFATAEAERDSRILQREARR